MPRDIIAPLNSIRVEELTLSDGSKVFDIIFSECHLHLVSEADAQLFIEKLLELVALHTLDTLERPEIH